MNPLILLPLLVAGCVAAPSGSLAIHAAAVPYAVQHQVTAHVPAGVELKQVGAVHPVVQHVSPVAVPGYAVQGEVRQITQQFPEPAPVEVNVYALPVLGATGPVAYAPYSAFPAVGHYAAVPTVAAAEVKTVEAPAAVAHAIFAPAVAPALAYSNVNLNIPAPVPAGEAPAPEILVQRIPVKALGRPVVSYTPQITEVRPELNIIDRTYDVAVPKPVYETKEVTPIHHQYVPEPYEVLQPYAVPHPVAVPTPFNVPVGVPTPVHVQHNVVAQPAVQTYGYNVAAAQGVYHQVPAAHGVYHQVPAAQGVYHQVPAAQGVYHQVPAAHGVYHQVPAAVPAGYQHFSAAPTYHAHVAAAPAAAAVVQA